MAAVGIIGIGNMGGAMAQRLLALGWQVAVRDLDAAKERFLESKGAVAGVEWSSVAIKRVVTTHPAGHGALLTNWSELGSFSYSVPAIIRE